ncbi:MAG TPA: nicotinate (nicotinamide) nucleotide adenylyltransferase [Thermoanaerobaculia bacterium]|jgi:nicotinate-nucleotide adenylyltransferase|nr:nicotinate (nicotinamide) nucleotide adenylyltransferase [Thermoanaerobaculia bacterium]
MKIGLCGGTFDPFHRGHLDPILAVRGRMQWDQIIYIPAYIQPFKQEQATVSGYHRFVMAGMATVDYDDIFASTIELERGAVSYTVDTLEELRGQYPEATLDWVIGDDNLPRLGEWKSLDRIFELANFAVLTRGGAEPPPLVQARIAEPHERPRCGAVVFAENNTVPVSSTEIRRRIRAGESIDGLVDPRVARYIHHYALYEGSPA